MAHRVELSPKARRELPKLPRTILAAVSDAIDGLATNPRPPTVRKLTGHDHRYRVPVGQYRIVYEIRDEILLVLILTVGHRKSVYKGG